MVSTRAWRSFVCAGLILGGVAAAALASETTTYSYDAKGRLIKVDRVTTNSSGNTSTQYTLDKADNRNLVTVTTPP